MEIWGWVFIGILFLADFVVKIEPFKLGRSQPTERISGSAGDVLEDNPVGRLKVFVYELPSKYSKKILQKDPRCLNHMFAAEIYMHRFLLSSPVRTLNPEEADWFYTPVYTTCDLTPNGLPLPFKSPRMMRSAIQLISSNWPYWNRTEGADHFFLVPHDFGACFHYQVLPCPPLFPISCTVLYDNRGHIFFKLKLALILRFFPVGEKAIERGILPFNFATSAQLVPNFWDNRKIMFLPERGAQLTISTAQ
ncbi:hypothetical protein GOBAR_DD10095 [Gossypium barbadense]|nr:hypothetical protein GOBAR_DD10095 [Gossypium barbadense]